MKPNDENGKLPTAQRPFRVLIISGSDRRQYNCPGVDSKSRALMLRLAERLPQAWEIDYEDLGNVFARARIQSCNACASTAMPLCVGPCNCYEKHNKDEAEHMADDADILGAFDAWSDRFAKFVANKGKVPPGKYRAFGYTPPSHRWTSVKLWWRDKKMRIDRAPEGSSPQLQGKLAINQDITLTPQKGEGEKLRSDEQTSLMN